VGTAASIAGAKVTDLRDFHATRYVPSGIVLSAAGAVDHDAFVEQAANEFARRASRGPQPARDAFAGDVDRHVPRVELRAKETEQVHLVLAGRGLARGDDRRHAATLLDLVLGNAPSSRLFLEVRERRGLAYSVYSFLSSYADCGQAGIYVGVRPDRVRAVLDVLREELDRVTTEPPSEEELELAKGHVEGRMLLSLESTTVRGNRLGASLVTGMPIEPLDDVVAKLRAVTPDDVLALAQELYDPAGLSLAAVAEDVDDVRRQAAEARLHPGIDAEART
jgi:predicted Zn-dependent peptidase